MNGAARAPNRLTSARARRETYVGQWLPEPAKQHLAADRRRVEVDTTAARRIIEEFLAAALSGRTDELVRMPTDDAVSVGDGGGRVYSLSQPVTGALRVARFLRALFEPNDAEWEMIGGRPVLFATVANGLPALAPAVGDRLAGVVTLDVTTDGIAAVYAHVNPDKLVRAGHQWAAGEHGEPLDDDW